MKTILVVEDTDDLRELFMALLQSDGYRVLGAADGREALELLAGEGADSCLVLLDMMMPIMDGQMFLDTLRASSHVAPLPVVVVSASAVEGGVRGASGFVKKPVHPDVLRAIVRDYCGSPGE